MPVRAVPNPKTTVVDGFHLDDAAVRQISAQANAEGKVFSYSSITALAAKFDDGDKFLGADELSRALALIEPSQLPQQQGERAAAAVVDALQRAWTDAKSSQQVDAVIPAGWARIIIDRTGPVASSNEVFISAYVPPAALRRLRGSNEVYFERVAFGKPTETMGPFAITADGLGTTDVAPDVVADHGDEAALLSGLESQLEFRQAKAAGTLLSVDTFAFDATTAVDRDLYREVSARQLQRLSKAEAKEVVTLAAYQQFGGQTPAVNDWLRGSPRGKNIAVTLLDQALQRAVNIPAGTLLFRGFAGDSIQGKRGQVIVDPGYSSVSLDPGTARMFADNAGADGKQKVLLVIEAGPNAKGLFSGNVGETEVVLARSQPLRIIDQRKQQGYQLYHVMVG